jgi:hypothetical protein
LALAKETLQEWIRLRPQSSNGERNHVALCIRSILSDVARDWPKLIRLFGLALGIREPRIYFVEQDRELGLEISGLRRRTHCR